MKHAPPGYDCPFCRLAKTLTTPAPDEGIILEDTRILAFVPLHYYAAIKGNCLIAPRAHHENIFDTPAELGADIFHATRRIAEAMRSVFKCEGISTRQHNGPAGDQDVWHYHLHVFPRFEKDGLYGGAKSRYPEEERLHLAGELRDALRRG